MNTVTITDLINSLPPAKRQFLAYVKHDNPKLYNALVTHAARELHVTMGATPTAQSQQSTSFWDSLTSAVKGIGTAASTIVPTILNAKTNQQILQTQLKLAEQGKPPLNTSQITTPPTATVSFGTSKAVTYGMYAALGLLGVFLISKMKG